LEKALWRTDVAPQDVYRFSSLGFGRVPVTAEHLAELNCRTNTDEFLREHGLRSCTWARTASIIDITPFPDEVRAFVDRLPSEAATLAARRRAADEIDAFFNRIRPNIDAGVTFCADSVKRVPFADVIARASTEAPDFEVSAYTDHDCPGWPITVLLFRHIDAEPLPPTQPSSPQGTQ
jgi:hypothetical protein